MSNTDKLLIASVNHRNELSHDTTTAFINLLTPDAIARIKQLAAAAQSLGVDWIEVSDTSGQWNREDYTEHLARGATAAELLALCPNAMHGTIMTHQTLRVNAKVFYYSATPKFRSRSDEVFTTETLVSDLDSDNSQLTSGFYNFDQPLQA